MSVYKDNATGKWRVIYRYTDITGKRKQTQKRGFETKREAVAWEHEMMLKSQAKLDMTFGSFYEIYEADKASRLKQSTWETKSHIIRTKILPYFADRKIDEIEVRDVIAWQNELLAAFKDEGKEERYSQDYLRTIQAQLTAIFAHAMKYYNLPKNPSSLAGTIGKEVPKEMQFWTKEEYLKFAEVMMDKPRSYYAFELLYWTGIRSGELLALTPSDFDFEKQTLRINKTFHRSKGEDIITTPKTVKSNRIITLPPFLCDEIKDYLGMFFEIGESERMFSFTKSYLGHEMERGCKESGVKKIRIHDLRHSHVSLLINMGFSALAIGKRVGHEIGLITAIERIKKDGLPKVHCEIPEEDITDYIKGNVTGVNAEFIPIIEKGLQEYADSVEAKLREIKVDLKHENIVYVGGGASVMKKYGRTKGRNIQYVTDVKANAIGYRYLADNIG